MQNFKAHTKWRSDAGGNQCATLRIGLELATLSQEGTLMTLNERKGTQGLYYLCPIKWRMWKHLDRRGLVWKHHRDNTLSLFNTSATYLCSAVWPLDRWKYIKKPLVVSVSNRTQRTVRYLVTRYSCKGLRLGTNHYVIGTSVGVPPRVCTKEYLYALQQSHQDVKSISN